MLFSVDLNSCTFYITLIAVSFTNFSTSIPSLLFTSTTKSGVFVKWSIPLQPVVLCSSYRKISFFSIDQCRQLGFSAALAFRGKRLLNHKIKEVDNVAKDFCGALCFMEPNCISYNILVSNDSPSITKCEMNNATHFEHPSDLVSFSNSTYRGSKVCL